MTSIDATFHYATTRAWREAAELLATASQEFLSTPTSVSHAGSMSAPLVVAMRIPLSSVEHEIEIQITIATDRQSHECSRCSSSARMTRR
jgi:hypothetical protein